MAVDLGLVFQKTDRDYFDSLDRNTRESPTAHQRFFLPLAGDAVADVKEGLYFPYSGQVLSK